MEFENKNSKWRLSELLPDPYDESLQNQTKKLDQEILKLENYQSELIPQISRETFSEILSLLESINSTINCLQSYAYLWFSENTQNEKALNLRDQLDQTIVDYSNRILFFDLWFKDLPEQEANRLIDWSGDLKYLLSSVRRFKPYTLSEVEEKLINIKDVNGIDALVSLYEMITNRFSFSMQTKEEELKLTRDQLTGYFFDPSAEIRKNAYDELYRVYSDQAPILSQIYNHRVRDWHSEGISLRGYKSPISARNIGNDLPDDIVNTLLAVCRKNAPIFLRFFELKANWLGLKKLRRCDIYAPLTETDNQFDYDQARELVMQSFYGFSPLVADLANRVFDEQHIDPLPRPGKRGGAFCSAVTPKFTPWVAMNFSGRLNDVLTLAHELGHAVHAMLAQDHSVMTFHASLPLAETASVFAEMNMAQHLLKEEKDLVIRRNLLAHLVDNAYITVLRQAFFTLFEIDAHRMILEGCSNEDLADHYLASLREQFGDAVEISDQFRWEWITVPHFYNEPFYTYAYSFGQLLVLALYQKYQNEGSEFIPNYLRILSYGGSDSPINILKTAEIEIHSTEFWQLGFDIIEEFILELENIGI